MTFAHYALIVTMSLLCSIGAWVMMYEDNKANDILVYVAIAIAVVGLLIIYFGR